MASAQEGEGARVCGADLNQQTVYSFKLKKALYEQSVGPSMRQIVALHSRAFAGYEVPFDVFWRIAGLDLFLGPSPPPCCPICSETASTCVPALKFRKSPSGDNNSAFADFEWDDQLASRPPFQKNTPEYSAAIALPHILKGFATISPNGVHLFYGLTPRDSLPNLKVELRTPSNLVGKTSIFDDDVFCTATLVQWGILVPHQRGNAIPHLTLQILPQ